MTPLEYAARGLPVFPCREREPGRKHPYTPRGFYDATRDPEIIRTDDRVDDLWREGAPIANPLEAS